MAAIHLSTTELYWLLQHAREFGPPWLARKLERESNRSTPNPPDTPCQTRYS